MKIKFDIVLCNSNKLILKFQLFGLTLQIIYVQEYQS